MNYFSGNPRLKSAVFFAVTFTGLFYLIGVAVQFVAIVGPFLAEAMIQGSPLVWLGMPILSLVKGPAGNILIYVLVLGPYPLAGWVIGYRWPLIDASLTGLLRAVVFRFGMVWLPIEVFGLWWVLTYS